MDVQEAPRIGNRSDALDLLDSLIEKVDDITIEAALEALRDAVDREVL
ncbi:MAG: hypothetical protein LBI67_11785 [Treponema sp.]|jgi:hypothetical protein|nr:hypothetical protein [Treponema sp.]